MGLGTLSFGLGVDYLGMALGFVLIIGMTAAIGARARRCLAGKIPGIFTIKDFPHPEES